MNDPSGAGEEPAKRRSKRPEMARYQPPSSRGGEASDKLTNSEKRYGSHGRMSRCLAY